jgi:hypothetical protein
MATKKKPTKPRKSFQQELIDAILNEDNKFDMGEFKSGSLLTTATCNTARCMAGHIEALRPKRAKELAKELGLRTNDGMCSSIHSDIAGTIWKEETGQECRLDFFGNERHGDMKYAREGGVRFLDDMTREETVAHIQGKNPEWPLLNR